jgi:hypothetical protein
MTTKLKEIMARASSEVGKWPEWKRSADVKAELRRIEQRQAFPSSATSAGTSPNAPAPLPKGTDPQGQ